ncbi:hypothetical protein HYT25_03915 [Candidatus Pacearchaeota archaeon]|nr:hypothetical protein [Candidatus Pacearchaeota archaeon]
MEQSEISFDLKSILKKNKNYFLIMNYPENSENEDEISIVEEDIFRLKEELKKIKEKDKINIILILNSNGGNPYTTYKIVNILHKKCDYLIVLIPHFAKSAATLLSLGANSIIMDEQSELGPLDLPFREHPIKGGIKPLSALDGIKPLSYLFDSITTIAIDDLGLKIRQDTGLSIKECIEIALKFSSDYLQPITSQLDPWILNMCQRSLQIAKIYGTNLLKNYMFYDDPLKSKKADDIAHNLVYGFPTHSFAITIDQAQKLGLNVVNSIEYDKWDLISDFYNKILRRQKTKYIKIMNLNEIEDLCKKID